MRALFTTDQQVGHFRRLVPIARALEATGHLVAFASLPDLTSTVEACGFRSFPIGSGVRELPDLIAWCEEWNPDVIVIPSTECAGATAAGRCQIPHANLNADESEGDGLPTPAVSVSMLEHQALNRESYRTDSRNS